MANSGDSGTYSPETLKLRRRVAEAMLKSGMETGPIQHWAQGASRLMHALVGGTLAHDADKQERAADAATLASLPGMGGAVNAQTPPGTASPMGPDPGPSNMTRVGDPAPVTVNSNAAPQFSGLMTDLERSGIRIDPSQTGGYANRNIRGTNTPSMHASGNAVDINWQANPEGAMPGPPVPNAAPFDPMNMAADASGDRPGQTQIPPEIARALARKHGLRSGYDFRGRSPDGMHFEVGPNAATPLEQRTLIAQTPHGSQPPAQPPQQQPAPGGIPPQAAQVIRTLYANPATRAAAIQMYTRLVSAETTPTDERRNYDAYVREELQAGRQPRSSQDWIIERKRAGAPNTNLQIETRGEVRQSQLLGEQRAKDEIAIRQGGDRAYEALGVIGLQRRAVSDPQFYSGPLAENVVMPLKQLAAALGGDPNQVRSMETFSAQANRGVLTTLGSLGAGISNADRDFIQRSVANLGNSPGGNTALLDIAEKIEQRKIQVAQFLEEYSARHGRVDDGFTTALRQWREQNPLFTQQDMERILPVAPGGGGGNGGGGVEVPGMPGVRMRVIR